MFKEFAKLNTRTFNQKLRYCYTDQPVEIVDVNAPALSVFTDFQMREPETIRRSVLASEANEHMKSAKIKSLLVVNADDIVIGFVSSAHLQGVYLVQAAEQNEVKPAEVTISMVMMDIHRIHMVAFKDLSNARVGHIARMLYEYSYHHLLVYDIGDDDEVYIRGMFSRSRLNRLLGMNIGADYSVSSVADINKYL